MRLQESGVDGERSQVHPFMGYIDSEGICGTKGKHLLDDTLGVSSFSSHQLETSPPP